MFLMPELMTRTDPADLDDGSQGKLLGGRERTEIREEPRRSADLWSKIHVTKEKSLKE